MFRLISAFLALLLLASCASTGGDVRLPPIPAWQAPADARELSAWQVRVEVAQILPGVPVHASDARYTLVSHAWLERYLHWTWEAALRTGVTYTPESFDCEDFALLFDALARLAASRSGQQTAPLLARLVVQQPAGRHELIGVATDRGLYVVEPQHRAAVRLVPLARYPHPILSLVLGDYNP